MSRSTETFQAGYQSGFPLALLATLIAAMLLGMLSAPESQPTARAGPPRGSERAARIPIEMSFWEQRLERDPYDYSASASLAALLLERSRMSGSDDDARRAETLAQRSLSQQQKNNPAARLALAQALMQRHQFALALEQTQLAALERPKDPAIRLYEVDALLGLGELPKARERLLELPKAAESIPGKLRLAQMSFLYDERERSAQLWMDCLEALRGQPEEAWVLVMMGHQEMLLGRLERARARFREVLKSDSKNVLALEHLAETFEMAGDTRRARVLLEDSLALDPAPEFMDRLAAILDNSAQPGDSERARELRARALAIYEDAARRDPAAHARSLADALLERELEPARALALARENLKYRRDSGSLITLAAALRAHGQFPEALAAAREALQFQSPYPHWIEELILCARAAGDKTLAAAAERRLKAVNPWVARSLKG